MVFDCGLQVLPNGEDANSPVAKVAHYFPDFNDPSKLGIGKEMVERLTNLIAVFENPALRIDDAVKRVRPDGWRGVQAREQVIKRALFDILLDESEVERIFLIIKAQSEY